MHKMKIPQILTLIHIIEGDITIVDIQTKKRLSIPDSQSFLLTLNLIL